MDREEAFIVALREFLEQHGVKLHSYHDYELGWLYTLVGDGIEIDIDERLANWLSRGKCHFV